MENKNTRKRSIIAILCILAVLSVSGILAYFTDVKTKTNNLTMGKVEIALSEFTLDEDDSEIAWPDDGLEGVLPGDTVNKIVRINRTADSANCYVRAKVEFDCDDDDLKATNPLNNTVLDVNTTKWKLVDGYYYYTEELTSADPIELFTTVSIPATLNNTWADVGFTIKVTAEAIQSANFTPDFTSATAPWTGVNASDIVAYSNT